MAFSRRAARRQVSESPTAQAPVKPEATRCPNPAPSAVATRLGYLAAVPFVAGAALAWSTGGDTQAMAVRALVAYAAVVASFIGAIHWGFGFAQTAPRAGLFLWGVAPSIVAWLSLLVAPAAGLAVDAVLLVACYLVDRAIYPLYGAARWLPLRLRLTALAAASCALTGWAG